MSCEGLDHAVHAFRCNFEASRPSGGPSLPAQISVGTEMDSEGSTGTSEALPFGTQLAMQHTSEPKPQPGRLQSASTRHNTVNFIGNSWEYNGFWGKPCPQNMNNSMDGSQNSGFAHIIASC